MTDLLCRVEVERLPGAAVSRLHGEVDVSNVEHVEHELEAAVGGDEGIHIVDLSEVSYLDSAGIRLLFDIAARLRTRRRRLHVIVPADSVIRRLLEITDFARVIPIHTTVGEVVGPA